MGFDWFNWIMLPILIFLSRILDVSIGTIRIVFISRNQKFLAPLLGFFEVLIWLIAIGQIMNNLTNVFCYIAYAGGFATGNYVGLKIEEKLALGILIVRIITQQDSDELIDIMREKDFGVTVVPAEGARGPVNVLFTVIPRTSLPTVLSLIKTFNPKAFYSIENVRSVSKGVFPSRSNGTYIRRMARKGK